jgi:hypothetical protein
VEVRKNLLVGQLVTCLVKYQVLVEGRDKLPVVQYIPWHPWWMDICLYLLPGVHTVSVYSAHPQKQPMGTKRGYNPFSKTLCCQMDYTHQWFWMALGQVGGNARASACAHRRAQRVGWGGGAGAGEVALGAPTDNLYSAAKLKICVQATKGPSIEENGHDTDKELCEIHVRNAEANKMDGNAKALEKNIKNARLALQHVSDKGLKERFAALIAPAGPGAIERGGGPPAGEGSHEHMVAAPTAPYHSSAAADMQQQRQHEQRMQQQPQQGPPRGAQQQSSQDRTDEFEFDDDSQVSVTNSAPSVPLSAKDPLKFGS